MKWVSTTPYLIAVLIVPLPHGTVEQGVDRDELFALSSSLTTMFIGTADVQFGIMIAAYDSQ